MMACRQAEKGQKKGKWHDQEGSGRGPTGTMPQGAEATPSWAFAALA